MGLGDGLAFKSTSYSCRGPEYSFQHPCQATIPALGYLVLSFLYTVALTCAYIHVHAHTHTYVHTHTIHKNKNKS